MTCLRNPTFCDLNRDAVPDSPELIPGGCDGKRYPEILTLSFTVTNSLLTISSSAVALIWNPFCPATTTMVAGGWWQGFSFHVVGLYQVTFQFRFRPYPTDTNCSHPKYWKHQLAGECFLENGVGVTPFCYSSVDTCADCAYLEGGIPRLWAHFHVNSHQGDSLCTAFEGDYDVKGTLILP